MRILYFPLDRLVNDQLPLASLVAVCSLPSRQPLLFVSTKTCQADNPASPASRFPLALASANTLPLIVPPVAVGGGGGGGGACGVESRIQFTFPTLAVVPATSSDTRSTWTPSLSSTFLPIVVKVCHPPVFGTTSCPVLSTPSTSTCSFAFDPVEATRAWSRYAPASFTSMVYSSHSPARVQPTKCPPPASLVVATSTPVLRYAPPRLLPSASW